MRDIIAQGDIAVTEHHIKDGMKPGFAGKGNGRNSCESEVGSGACPHVRNFITSYQDILVVNIKCI